MFRKEKKKKKLVGPEVWNPNRIMSFNLYRSSLNARDPP